MFVARERELNMLEKYYGENKFHFSIFYGRRRVGKTTLIHKFIENKKAIFFTATETTAKENLELLSVQILSRLTPQAPLNPFASFMDAFEYCFNAAKKQRIVMVIDEYPYLAGSERAVSSILQAVIDKHKENCRLFLILCGSSMSFMENQVLGYKSPLYGRRTSQFKLLPFNYLEAAQMLPGFNNTEKIILYGMCGGIPEYLSHINNKLSVQQNAQNLFFINSGRFFEEPSNLIKQELKDIYTYNGIISAIASGASKINEIASRANIETSQCSNMLSTLIGLGIVKKEYPAGNEKPSRKTLYHLADNMFRFWYRFVRPELSRIILGYGEQVCAEIFNKSKTNDFLETFMGPVFEECSIQYLWSGMNSENRNYKTIGKWWGTNKKEKREEEIDIYASNGKNYALFGECKWKNERTGSGTFLDLVHKSELFPDISQKRYIIFSKSGFTSELTRIAAERDDIKLITLAQMFL